MWIAFGGVAIVLFIAVLTLGVIYISTDERRDEIFGGDRDGEEEDW